MTKATKIPQFVADQAQDYFTKRAGMISGKRIFVACTECKHGDGGSGMCPAHQNGENGCAFGEYADA